MVVCKFFLQGSCKFGSSCKYEHQINDSSSIQSARQNVNSAGSAVPDLNTLVRSVQTDMNNTEKGGQWLLSCYAPYKEKAAFPGFEDKSFEEVRLGFYEANKNGTVEQFKQQLQAFLQEAVMKIRALQNPTSDIVNVLKQLYNTPVNATGFGAQQNQASTFGGNVFSAPAGNSIFNRQGNAGYGSASIFSNSPVKPSPFASPVQGQGIFGGGTKPPETSIFGGSPSMFPGKPPAALPFNVQNPFAAKPDGSVFANQFAPSLPSAGTFAAPLQGNSPLLASPNTSPFKNTSPFVSQPSPFTAQSPFVQTNAQTQAPFGQNTQSIFSQNAQSIFAPNAPHQSPLAQNNVQAQSPFAQNQSPLAQSSIQTQSPFAQNQSPLAQNNVPTQSPFAQNQSPFASQTGVPTQFGVGTGVQPQPTFAQNASPFPMQTPAINNSPFTSMIPQNQNPPPFPTQQSQTGSIFGGQPPAFGNVFGQQVSATASVDESLYSKQEDLTKEELDAFKSEAFVMGQIPDKPPPVQLCF